MGLVVPASPVNENDLREFTRTRLSAFKVPKQVLLVDAVRRAPNGKADYKWAKQYVLDQID